KKMPNGSVFVTGSRLRYTDDLPMKQILL
ncbi:MAG: hypothetical protein ACI8Z5_000886, partial [Lentimonas sp.]